MILYILVKSKNGAFQAVYNTWDKMKERYDRLIIKDGYTIFKVPVNSDDTSEWEAITSEFK